MSPYCYPFTELLFIELYKRHLKTSNYPTLSIFFIRPPPGLLPVLGPLERYMTPRLDAALLSSSRAGADLGRKSDVESDASPW